MQVTELLWSCILYISSTNDSLQKFYEVELLGTFQINKAVKECQSTTPPPKPRTNRKSQKNQTKVVTFSPKCKK